MSGYSSAQKDMSANGPVAFVNNPEDVVPEAIEGLLELNPELLRVEGQNVVVRRDYEQLKAAGQVALVSGGGSGHD